MVPPGCLAGDFALMSPVSRKGTGTRAATPTPSRQREAKGFVPWGPGRGAPSQPLPSKVAWGVETHACLPAEPWEKVSPAGRSRASLVLLPGPLHSPPSQPGRLLLQPQSSDNYRNVAAMELPGTVLWGRKGSKHTHRVCVRSRAGWGSCVLGSPPTSVFVFLVF